MVNGAAYSFASGSELNKLTNDIKVEVISIYADALKAIWQAAVAFACLGFFAVFVERHVELRTQLHTEFGLEEPKKIEAPDEAGLTRNEEMASFSATAPGERVLERHSSADATEDSIPVQEANRS